MGVGVGRWPPQLKRAGVGVSIGLHRPMKAEEDQAGDPAFEKPVTGPSQGQRPQGMMAWRGAQPVVEGVGFREGHGSDHGPHFGGLSRGPMGSTGMVLELFLDLYSPPCRAIYIFTRKNSIPFEMHPVELAQGEQS